MNDPRDDTPAAHDAETVTGPSPAGVAKTAPPTAAHEEVEIKLTLDPGAANRLRRHPFVTASRQGRARSRTLRTVYYDTDDLALVRHGLWLRLRSHGQRHLQSVKTRSSGQGGLYRRDEWECPVPTERPDLDALPELDLRAIIGKAALHPLFQTTIKRTAWRLSPPPGAPGHGAALMLALDEGELRCGNAVHVIREAEFELVSGRPAHLYEIALALLDDLDFRLATQSKAGRGLALYLAEPVGASKATPTGLDPAKTVAQAFQAIGSNCLSQIQANEACVMADTDPEGVHQMRVGLRRLRSAASVFKDVLADPDSRAVLAEVKWLTGELGPARDWTVLRDEILTPVIAALPRETDLGILDAAAVASRDEAARRAAEAVRSKRYTRLLLRLAAWIDDGAWRQRPGGEEASPLESPIIDRAVAILDRRQRKALKVGRKIADLSEEQRHALRIEVKKLRYATEFFADLFPGKRTRKFRDALAALQDLLGTGNDVAVADGLLAGLVGRGAGSTRRARAVGIVAGFHGHRLAALEPELTRAWKDFAGRPPFWR